MKDEREVQPLELVQDKPIHQILTTKEIYYPEGASGGWRLGEAAKATAAKASKQATEKA